MKTYINLKTKYKPKNKFELANLVNDLSIKLWEIDTSLITDMSDLFVMSNRKENEDFKGIDLWDVSNVKSMYCTFFGCKNFNQPLDKWDTRNVKNMTEMFYNCKSFNQDISTWIVSNVRYKEHMFKNCPIREDFKPKGIT